MISDMQLMHQKSTLSLDGCQRKLSKVELGKQFNGIWIMKIGGEKSKIKHINRKD